MKSYKDNQIAESYLDFTNSEDGQQQIQLIGKAIKEYLLEPGLNILEVGCGTGWLTNELALRHSVCGVDISPLLLEVAKKKYPALNFQLGDIEQSLAYKKETFDIVVANLVIHNLNNQLQSFRNLIEILKPQGRLIFTVPNPYLAFPAGLWKRGLWRWLLRLKPILRLRPYNHLVGNQAYTWRKNIPVNFYALADQINAALAAGFSLEKFMELKTATDNKKFNFNYRLFRFPLVLMLVFKKSAE